MVKLSLHLFGLHPEEYLPATELAERAGFEAVWLAEHVATPLSSGSSYPYSRDGQPFYDPDTPLVDVTVAMAYLAARTSTMKFGTGVFVLPLRNPFLVAKAWATLQNFSAGRVMLGIGVGWLREEFEAVGAEFRRRGRRMEEMIEVMNRLWTGQPVAYDGEFYRFEQVQVRPAPDVPVPMVFGGTAPRALERAARLGDGWYGPRQDLSATIDCRDVIERHRRELGKTNPFVYYARLKGEPVKDEVQRYADTGFEHVVLQPFSGFVAGGDPDERRGRLEQVLEALDALH